MGLPEYYDEERALRSKIGELAYDLKLAGWSWPRLFEFLAGRIGKNLSVREVREIVKECYYAELRDRREIVKKVDDLRQIEIDRLDRMLLSLDSFIQQGDYKAVTAAHKIIETRINLLGIKPPKRVEVTHTEMTPADREVERILRDVASATELIEDDQEPEPESE